MLPALARRGGGGGRSIALSAWPLVVLTAMLALSYVAPALAFVAASLPSRNTRSGTRSTKDEARLAPLYGIKRKVTFEMEENVSDATTALFIGLGSALQQY